MESHETECPVPVRTQQAMVEQAYFADKEVLLPTSTPSDGKTALPYKASMWLQIVFEKIKRQRHASAI